MAFNHPRDATSDVEKASNDVHLHNDIIDTFCWERVSVKVKDKTQDKHLLESIDGAAYAGQSNFTLSSPLSTPDSKWLLCG